MSDAWKDDDSLDRWFEWAAGRMFYGRLDDEDFDAVATANLIKRRGVSWGHLKTECDSPIEAILGAFLLFAMDGYNDIEWDAFPGQFDLPTRGTVFRTQHKIGAHRVDFQFLCICGKIQKALVVECDGHDFHERTKQQAARDKSRDRDILKDGASVIRFTGSEIYRDPVKCVEEIEAILTDLIDAAVKESALGGG